MVLTMSETVAGRTLNLALSVIGARSTGQVPESDFYIPPRDIPATPGTVIRTESARFFLDPLKLVAAPAKVLRIMFSSTDRHGEPIAVTGTLLTSTRSKAPVSARRLVVFAVGTQGMAERCAPSRQMAVGREYESVFITGLLARGYDVVVPDYQGHGAMSAVHTYMGRVVQGHVVLDALRAALSLDPAEFRNRPVALTGYSQGGGACASAAELWHEYATELNVIGAVAGAAPADLYRTARFLDGGPYFAFLAYTVAGIAADYGIDVGAILNARGQALLWQIRHECLFESLRSHAFTKFSQLTQDGSGIADLMRAPAFEEILRAQRLGEGRSPRMPMMLVHSRLDDVVPYECSRALAERWVSQGARVRLVSGVAPGHIPAMATSYRSAYAFLNARFSGAPMRANTKRYLQSLAAESDPGH